MALADGAGGVVASGQTAGGGPLGGDGAGGIGLEDGADVGSHQTAGAILAGHGAAGIALADGAAVDAGQPATALPLADDGGGGIGLGDGAGVSAGDRPDIVTAGQAGSPGQRQVGHRAAGTDHAEQPDIVGLRPVHRQAGDRMAAPVEPAGEAHPVASQRSEAAASPDARRIGPGGGGGVEIAGQPIGAGQGQPGKLQLVGVDDGGDPVASGLRRFPASDRPQIGGLIPVGGEIPSGIGCGLARLGGGQGAEAVGPAAAGPRRLPGGFHIPVGVRDGGCGVRADEAADPAALARHPAGGVGLRDRRRSDEPRRSDNLTDQAANPVTLAGHGTGGVGLGDGGRSGCRIAGVDVARKAADPACLSCDGTRGIGSINDGTDADTSHKSADSALSRHSSGSIGLANDRL